GGPQGRGGPGAHRSGAPGTGRAYCEAMTSPNTQAATDPTTRLTAVVTGASSGIGRATAQRLVADGWRVLAVARREDRLRALAERARELFGETLNAVVHVAGGALGVDPVAEADLDRWQGMYETNVLGALRVTRALLPALRRSGRGDVLFVTSVAAHEAYPGGSGYNAAKAGEHMLARTLRLELNGEKVRVIEIAPGMVRTEEFSLVRLGDQEAADAVYDGVEQPLTAEDCADVISYALGAPHHVNLDLVTVRPLAQAA